MDRTIERLLVQLMIGRTVSLFENKLDETDRENCRLWWHVDCVDPNLWDRLRVFTLDGMGHRLYKTITLEDIEKINGY